jgi:hypothetical protein
MPDPRPEGASNSRRIHGTLRTIPQRWGLTVGRQRQVPADPVFSSRTPGMGPADGHGGRSTFTPRLASGEVGPQPAVDQSGFRSSADIESKTAL